MQNKERAYHGLFDIAGQQPFHDSISKEVFPSGIRHWAMAANKMAKDVYEMGIKVLKNFVHVTRKIGKL